MGYSYGRSPMGRMVLCCDHCGHAGGCRKIDCKFGYCQAVSLCEACRHDRVVRDGLVEHCETHCRQATVDWDAHCKREAELLAAGEYVRTSAIGCIGVDRVAVTFRNANGHEAFAEMSSEAYRAIPLLTPATPADYGVEAFIVTSRRRFATV